MAYSTTRTIMINFTGSVSGLMNSTRQVQSMIERLGSGAANIGKAFLSALTLNFKPLLKTVVGGITAFAKVLLVMPAFLLALVNPMSVVTIAMTGFTQAITATSPQEFVGATRNMAPAMQAAVAAIRFLEPQLKNLYGIVEQGFWSGFTDDLNNLVALYLPILDKGLGNIGTMLGQLRHDLFAWLSTPEVVAAISKWMDAFAGLGKQLLPLIENLLPSLLSLFVSITQIMISLAPLVATVAGWFAKLLGWITPVITGVANFVGGLFGGGSTSTGGTTGGGGTSGGGSTGSSSGGFLSNLWHGITGFFSSLFGGGRAAGGPVFGGYSYLVGERGPEMLRMGTNGFVQPNAGNQGHTFLTVKIGEQELQDMVTHEIRRSNQAVATMARMGRGLVI